MRLRKLLVLRRVAPAISELSFLNVRTGLDGKSRRFMTKHGGTGAERASYKVGASPVVLASQAKEEGSTT